MRRFHGLLIVLTLVLSVATSCHTEKKADQNPFFEQWTTPYGVPPFDRIRPEHFPAAVERAISEQNAEIDAITTNNDRPTFDNTTLAFDNTGATLARTMQIFRMLSLVEHTPEMQKAEEEILPLLAAHTAEVMSDDRLFARIKEVYDKRSTTRYPPEQLRLVEKQYTAFVHEGALLDDAQKQRLQKINEELALARLKFGRNIATAQSEYRLLIDDEKRLIGLPNEVRLQSQRDARAIDEKGSWLFTLDEPSMIPFLSYSSDRDLRKEIYTAYLNLGANDNEYNTSRLINDLIRLRTEKAHLLGYSSFAEYALSEETAGTPKAVYDLLDEIWEPALKQAKKDLEEMQPLFKRDFPNEEFAAWDWWYYAEKLRKQKFSLDEEMLRPYFTVENVKGGIFFLANRLFGITFRPVSLPMYHQDVTAFEVFDTDESHLGILLLDLYTRPEKIRGTWSGCYIAQGYKNEERIAPVVSVVTNYAVPSTSNPTLLSTDQVEMLFHEFGHALQMLFLDVKYNGLKTAEDDFVELPSQLMTNWAFESEVLRHYATHYRTKEMIPDHLTRKLHRSRLFNQAFKTTSLVASALSDLDIHSIKEYTEFNPADFEHNALGMRRGLIPQIAPRHRYPAFTHIFAGDYAARYYSYPWAEVLDKDAFEAFRETGDLFNRKVAKNFRQKILARGGEADGKTLYRNFRGKDPDRRTMLLSLGLIEKPEEDSTELKIFHSAEIHSLAVRPEAIDHKPIMLYKKEQISTDKNDKK